MYKQDNLGSLTSPGYHSAVGLQAHPDGEQRLEGREINGERLFVQITQAAERHLVGKTLSCTAVDASAHGVKFLTDELVPVGCLIDLWVDDHSRPGKFFLSGDVRWTQKATDNQSIIGVRLQEGIATDFNAWQETYAEPC